MRQDEELQEHCLRTEMLVMAICNELHFDADAFKDICLAARYHDIGKIEIPKAILDKPGKLTQEEFEIMKSHTEAGYEITKEELKQEIRDMIRYHHENEDGSGYHGLFSAEIPMGSKILHICDVYDALVSDRKYKEGWPKEKALMFMRANKGTMFDTDICTLFVKIVSQRF